jgi:hypothetical protein
LEPLPVPADLWFIIVVPNVRIPAKTASLSACLSSADFSHGSRIAAQAARLKSNLSVDATLLENVFIRPLYDVVPSSQRCPALCVKPVPNRSRYLGLALPIMLS